MTRESVVLGEVARGGARLAEREGDAADSLLGDVLVEGARGGASGEDARDSVGVEGAKAGGVAESGVEVGRRVALAEEQDLARLMSPDAHRSPAHELEEGGGVLSHLLEGDAELVEIDRALASRGRVQSGGVELEPESARRELVARDTGQVGGIDEELSLSDADRQQVGDMVVGDRVGVALPGDEAVDGAEAINDTRGVVGVAR